LAEQHVPGSSVGPTFREIIADQFQRTRDGDRFWYQAAFRDRELEEIQETTLASVIRRNTNLVNIQSRVFYFVAGASGMAFVDSIGDGRLRSNSRDVVNRSVQLIGGEDEGIIASTRTDAQGNYQFDVLDGVRTGTYYVQVLSEDDSHPVATSQYFSITRGDQMLRSINIPLKPRS